MLIYCFFTNSDSTIGSDGSSSNYMSSFSLPLSLKHIIPLEYQHRPYLLSAIMAVLLMLFILMSYQMSLHPPPPPAMLQVPTPPSGLSSLANGYHSISNIFTSSLLLKENTNNVYDANNQYRLDIQSKATSNSKGMDMMNSDSSISINDNYRLSMTSKDKDKDKVYCYSTKVSSTGHFDIICTEAKLEELAATPSRL